MKKVKDGTTVNPVLNDSLQKIVEVSSTEATGSIGFVGYISNEDPTEESFTVKFSVVSRAEAIVAVLWESGTFELPVYDCIEVSTPFFCLGSAGGNAATLGLYVTRTAGTGAETSCIGTVYNLSDGIDIETINGVPPITADDIADKVLKTPANLLATDANGRVDLGAVGGSADAAASLAVAAAKLANKSTYTVNETTGVGTEVVRNLADTADLYTITYTDTAGVQTRSAAT